MANQGDILRRQREEKQRAYYVEQRRRRAEEKRVQEEKVVKALRSRAAPSKPRGPMEILKSEYFNILPWVIDNAIRDPKKWRPVGRSADALFFSFVTHSLVKHPVPKVLYQCLTQEMIFGSPREFFIRAAKGESVYKTLKETLTLPMTRKWAHLLMTETHHVNHPFKAFRLAQVLSHGGSQRLYNSLPVAKATEATMQAHEFEHADKEKFLDEVIAWLCRQTSTVAMFDYNQVEPMLDFFDAAYYNNRTYTVAGRTLTSVMKAMNDWHRATTKNTDKGDKGPFPSCGVRTWARKVEYQLRGRDVIGEWKIEEILTDKRLREEGSAMHHCVGSYADRIRRGDCSVFSLTFNPNCEFGGGEDEKQATIRLDKNKVIVEARTYCNGKLAANQIATMRRWAMENQIVMGGY